MTKFCRFSQKKNLCKYRTGKDVFGLITKSYYQRLLSWVFVTQSAGPIHLFNLSITSEERIKIHSNHVKVIQLINRTSSIKPLQKFIRIASLRVFEKMYLSLVICYLSLTHVLFLEVIIVSVYKRDSCISSQFSNRFRCKYFHSNGFNCSLFPVLSIHVSTIC